MVPELEKVAEFYGDRCRFLKVDSDEEPEVASVLRISGLPTILFISDMSVVARAEGASGNVHNLLSGSSLWLTMYE